MLVKSLLVFVIFVHFTFANGGKFEFEKINEKPFENSLGEMVQNLDLMKISSTNITLPPNHEEKFAYVTWSEIDGFDIHESNQADFLKEWVARARFENLINNTGWSFLEVESSSNFSDEIQAEAAGLLEGFLTKDLIFYSYKNIVEHYWDGKSVEARNKTFATIKKTLNWMLEQIKEKDTTDPIWHQLNLLIKQFFGLQDGYKKATNGTERDILVFNDFFHLVTFGEIADIEEAMGHPRKDMERMLVHGTALIKLIGNSTNYSDIYSSHVTWGNYETMLRIIKRYKLPFHVTAAKDAPLVPGISITVSSYPGVLASYDDFLITSRNLFISQASFPNYNSDLWKNVHHKSIFTVDRVLIASRLATDGESWTRVFKQYQSGFLNSQWMIIDYNFFKPNKQISQEKLFWIVEELPGINIARDMTSYLLENGHWVSYNTPYFKEIFNASGFIEMERQHGDFFSWGKCPRAQMLKRAFKEGKGQDLKSTIELMRYNDFANDKLAAMSKCKPPYSACLGISARCDLNLKNGTYIPEDFGQRPFGGIDMKLTSFELNKLGRFIAIAGPTHSSQPPFQWSTSDLNHLPHFGMPDRFNFEPIIYEWKW